MHTLVFEMETLVQIVHPKNVMYIHICILGIQICYGPSFSTPYSQKETIEKIKIVFGPVHTIDQIELTRMKVLTFEV